MRAIDLLMQGHRAKAQGRKQIVGGGDIAALDYPGHHLAVSVRFKGSPAQ